MRRSEGLEFWTGLGAWLVGCPSRDPEVPLPDPLPSPPPPAIPMLGSPEAGSRARHLQSSAWSMLRAHGFSKALRLDPWPGIELFLPYWRGDRAVTTQGFTERVPGRKRALALVGKAAACRLCGWQLTAVVARWDDGIRDIFERGGVVAVSLDRLEEWLSLPPP